MTRTLKILLALDNLLGNLLFQGIGAEESISAYCWRRGYMRRVWLIDLFFGKGHCKSAFENESNGSHNAPEYRA